MSFQDRETTERSTRALERIADRLDDIVELAKGAQVEKPGTISITLNAIEVTDVDKLLSTIDRELKRRNRSGI